MAFEQDDYDKKFVKQVNRLIATKDEHKVFRKADDLVKLLGLPSKTLLSAIRAGDRHVPQNLRDQVSKRMEELIKRTSKKVSEQYTANLMHEAGSPPYNVGASRKLSEDLRELQVNLKTVLENQRIMMAHLSVDAVLNLERYVGNDEKRLNDLLQKRDKLIGAALQKAS
jgi:hypothetical protein